MCESWSDVRDNDVEFLITPKGCPDIFVRPCYRDIYSILDERWRGQKALALGSGKPCALITGTPGIGKSVFGLVLIKWLMQRPKPTFILYQPFCCNEATFFWQGRCFGTSASEAMRLVKRVAECQDLYSFNSHEKDKIEIWSIGDSQLPVGIPSIKQVCISSPGKAVGVSSQIKTWVKNNGAITLALPPCEWDEIVLIREAMFGDSADEKCPLTAVKERYACWGGVARTLLENPKLLDEAREKFRQVKIVDALQYLGTYSLDHQRHSGTIFHLFPAFKMIERKNWSSLYDQYSRPSYWWATETLERQAWLQFRREREANVIDFIDTLSNNPISRRKAWENLIHHYIEVSGIGGTLRNLETGQIAKDFVIPPTACAFFQSMADIDSSVDYWRPDSAQHKSCDSYLPSSGMMLQMTVGKEHSINISGLEEILKSNIFQTFQNDNPDKKLSMIFIVHQSVFNNFSKQSYEYNDEDPQGNSKNAADKRASTPKRKEQRKHDIEAKVTQYVMEVDWEITLKRLRRVEKKRSKEDDSEYKHETKRQKR